MEIFSLFFREFSSRLSARSGQKWIYKISKVFDTWNSYGQTQLETTPVCASYAQSAKTHGSSAALVTYAVRNGQYKPKQFKGKPCNYKKIRGKWRCT